MTHFGLLRHAETDWNRKKLIQGQTDTSLTPEGESQARQWGRRLAGMGLDRIISSDLGRARHSAALINEALGLPVSSDPRLREQDWGELVGRRLADVRKEDPVLLDRLEAQGWDLQPPGGESRREVLARILAVLEETASAHPGSRVLIVTHEGAIKCLAYHLAGRLFLPSEPRLLQPGCLHWITVDERGPSIEQLNALTGETGRADALDQ